MAKMSLGYTLKGIIHAENLTIEEIDKDKNSKFYNLQNVINVFDGKTASFTLKEDSEITPIRDEDLDKENENDE